MRNGILDQLYKDGYVVLDGLLTPEEISELRTEGTKLAECAAAEPASERVIFSTATKEQGTKRYFLESGDKVRYFWEKDALKVDGTLTVDAQVALNKVGHALHLLNPVFKKITFDERVKEICWQLGMSEPAVAQSMYIYKNPGTGSEVTVHQDATYLYTEPVNLVGFWLALDDATIENGCLWVAPGSHRSDVHRRYIRNPDPESPELIIYTSPEPVYQKSAFRPVPVSKGTCILIHGQVVHYSEANKSTKPRHVYTFHVVEQKNTTYSEQNWLQPTVETPFPSVYKTK